MDIKREYNNLYQHWSKEVQESDLTLLTQEDFDNYKKSVDYIKNFKLKKEDIIQNEVLKSYKDNFQYLYTDFLKLREIKIFNAALALQEIDFKKVIEAEKLFFQNLVSSIKGFKKLREIPLHEDLAPLKIDNNIAIPNIENKMNKNEIIEFNDLDHVLEIEKKKKIIKPIEDDTEKESYDYTLIRFLKKTPPLVGIDLKNYGPFEKEDVAFIPYKNAIILLSEKFAVKIDISH